MHQVHSDLPAKKNRTKQKRKEEKRKEQSRTELKDQRQIPAFFQEFTQ